MTLDRIQSSRRMAQRLDRLFGWLMQLAISPVVLFWMWLLWQKFAALFPGQYTHKVQRFLEDYLIGGCIVLTIGSLLLAGFVNVAISHLLMGHKHAFKFSDAVPLAHGDSVGAWRTRLRRDGSLSILRRRVPAGLGFLARIAADSCITLPIYHAWQQHTQNVPPLDIVIDLLVTLCFRCLPFVWWTNWYTLPTEIVLEPTPEPTLRIHGPRWGVWPSTRRIPAASVESIIANNTRTNYNDVLVAYTSDDARVVIRAKVDGRTRAWRIGGFGIAAVLPWNRARMAVTLRAFVNHAKGL